MKFNKYSSINILGSSVPLNLPSPDLVDRDYRHDE